MSSARPLLVLIAAVLGISTVREPRDVGQFIVRDVRVFDGKQTLEHMTVTVQNGIIASVGPETSLAQIDGVVDGRGRTLLPGLIDAHAGRRRKGR